MDSLADDRDGKKLLPRRNYIPPQLRTISIDPTSVVIHGQSMGGVEHLYVIPGGGDENDGLTEGSSADGTLSGTRSTPVIESACVAEQAFSATQPSTPIDSTSVTSSVSILKKAFVADESTSIMPSVLSTRVQGSSDVPTGSQTLVAIDPTDRLVTALDGLDIQTRKCALSKLFGPGVLTHSELRHLNQQ